MDDRFPTEVGILTKIIIRQRRALKAHGAMKKTMSRPRRTGLTHGSTLKPVDKVSILTK